MIDRFAQDGDKGIIFALCGTCVHKSKKDATCKAFPDGIPDVFLTGKQEHTKPYRGDHGIQYKAIVKEYSPYYDESLMKE